jgi:inhibitor of cysteine peptidase
MKKTITSLLILSVLFHAGCHNRQTESSYAAGQSGTIEINVGDKFIIRLESNPTTGYSWSLLESSSGIVEKVSTVFEPHEREGRLLGSGGTEVWTLKAVAKGRVTLTFDYVRPWEAGGQPIKEETYTVLVK